MLIFMEIKAECERKANSWRIRVPELDNMVISSKRLDIATEQIKDLVHESQGVDRCNVIVKVETTIPGIMCDLQAAQKKMIDSQLMQEQASREIRDVVSRLRDEGISMRDIGALLGISAQRVSQLVETAQAT
jgi:hypothetical protein